HLRAWTGRSLGHVPVARPRAQGTQRDPCLVAAPRRVQGVNFQTVSSLLFAASVAVTVAWGASMSAMGGMPMPGGWTMSMAWMRMPGQSFAFMTMSFLGMWVVMLLAMVPMLRRYREVVGGIAGARLGWLTTLVAAGYFIVWILIGVAAFPLG